MALTGYKQACITYINKNGLVSNEFKPYFKDKDQYFQDFLVNFDPDMWKNTEEKLNRINKTIDELEPMTMEEREPLLPSKLKTYYECTFCAFKPICRTGRKKKQID